MSDGGDTVPIADFRAEPEQGDDTEGGERSRLSGAGGLRACAALLLRARRAGAERPISDDNRQRRHPMGHHRSRHLESSCQTIHATRRLSGQPIISPLHRVCVHSGGGGHFEGERVETPFPLLKCPRTHYGRLC